MNKTRKMTIPVSEETYKLFNGLVKIYDVKGSHLIRKTIVCGLFDQEQKTPDYDLQHISPKMIESNKSHKLGTTITDEQYQGLIKLKHKLGLENMSSLVRRMLDTLILDHYLTHQWLKIPGLMETGERKNLFENNLL